MAALSDYAENLILNWLMKNTGSAPSSIHLALYTSAPNDAGGGTELTNGTNGYARQAITWDTATGTGGTTQNTSPETFTASGGDWGTITHIGLHDAATGGNLLWHGALTGGGKAVDDGDSLQFAAGAIDLTIA